MKTEVSLLLVYLTIFPVTLTWIAWEIYKQNTKEK